MDTAADNSLSVKVGELWAAALQRDTLPPADANFFESGGDSLAMMIFLFTIKESLGVDLTPDALMEAPSFGAFCEVVKSSMGSTASINGVVGANAQIEL